MLAHLDSLHGYATVLTRRVADSEDLLQDALVRGFKSFRTYDRSLSFKAWMFTIIRNAHIDRLRRRRVRPAETELGDDERGELYAAHDALASTPLAPEEILLKREAIEQVRDAIRGLPPSMREVVELRDVEGLSYQDIARVIDRPVGTVMSRLYRGRNLVRSYLVERRQQEGPWVGIRDGL
ncbi:MAG: sigma-70 family RNA polymerase sigma factor [Candidatus Rokuibacteriota bacterium]